MTTPSDSLASSALDPPAAPAAQTATRPLYWSVRRELWENRSIYIAPLIAAGVVLFALSIAALNFSRSLRPDMALAFSHPGAMISVPYSIAAMVIILTAGIVAVFYCLGALHNERRDRSILFWKSLPVSDSTTVLSKAIIPMVVLPLVTLVIVIATQLVMVLLNSVILLGHGLSLAILGGQLPLARLWLVTLYGLIASALWYAPIYGWLLLVSGWARRAPFLWAVLPPLALCLIERIALGTSYLTAILGHRINGIFAEAFAEPVRAGVGADFLPKIELASFLTSPGVWIGLVVAAAFIAAAVWQRRYREPV